LVQKAPAPVPQAFGVAAGQAQVPFAQACPAGQVTPQAPQLLASVWSVAQYPCPPEVVQADWPAEQPWTHWPLEHTCPAPHVVPHAPQFCGSFCRFVQKAPAPVPQAFGVAAGQAQVPFEQVCPAGQAMPQPPQLFGSLPVVAQ
jgi:hypothetical protein